MFFSLSNHANPPSAPDSSFQIFSAGSGNSSARSPKPGISAVHPHSGFSICKTSTWSVSPGCAPSTYTGPLTWSKVARFRVSIDLTVDSAVSCPFEASKQSNVTLSPDLTCSAGGMLCDQPWHDGNNVAFYKYLLSQARLAHSRFREWIDMVDQIIRVSQLEDEDSITVFARRLYIPQRYT